MDLKDAKHMVLIDEAELVLAMFEYLTNRDPEQRPKGPARGILQAAEAVIDSTRDVNDKVALLLATDLTKLAMAFIMDKVNAGSIAEGRGELAKKISPEEARQ